MSDKAIEALKIGIRMRRAQTAFFRATHQTERQKALALSKRLEKEFDDAAKYALAMVGEEA